MNSIENKSEKIMTKEKLLERVNAFRISRVILTAFELDLFTALAAGPRTSDEIAGELKINPRKTDRLLRGLCTLGLTRLSPRGFSNTDFSQDHLVKGKPGYMGGLAHSVRLWDSWSMMNDVLRRGKPRSRRTQKASRGWPEGFIAAMHERAMPQAPEIMALLNLEGVRHTLDIGAGSGAYSMALLNARPVICATLFDQPRVIPLTRRYMENAGFSENVQYISGDFNRNRLGGGYDLVLLSAIIHMQSLEKNRRLFSRILRSLNPGGRLVIQDYIMSEDRLSPEAGVLFALNMAVNTTDGDTFTAGELRAVLKETGYGHIEVKETPFAASLLIAGKPAKS